MIITSYQISLLSGSHGGEKKSTRTGF